LCFGEDWNIVEVWNRELMEIRLLIQGRTQGIYKLSEAGAGLRHATGATGRSTITDGAALDQVWILDTVEPGEEAATGDWPNGRREIAGKLLNVGNCIVSPGRSPNFSPELFVRNSTIGSSNDVAMSCAHSPSQAVGHCLARRSERFAAIG
jgi:hypothetical protein